MATRFRGLSNACTAYMMMTMVVLLIKNRRFKEALTAKLEDVAYYFEYERLGEVARLPYLLLPMWTKLQMYSKLQHDRQQCVITLFSS